MNWTPWQYLKLKCPINREALKETLDGGQAFRWKWMEEEDCWEGIWGTTVARLKHATDDRLQISLPKALEAKAEIGDYLKIGTDWQQIIDQLPWRSDEILKTSISAFQGLRILKQPFGETLLAFLCSATKQIPQIKIMCENLAQTHGEEIVEGYHALPSWQRLSNATETELRKLGLGFRAKNIKRTADILADSPERLSTIESLPYAEAKEELMQLPGVGEKIADCALLFGAEKLDAFPVDTWILKSLQNRYGLHDWNAKQLTHFGRIHFGEYAGLAQQFLFSWERSES